MAKLPIRPIIVVEAFPKEVEKNQILQISARLFDKQTLALMEVNKIYMTITSVTDGHTIWPLEGIRKNASGFDIGIGTQEMKEGHTYLVRVSNNLNLSPSASVEFTVKEGPSIVPALIPIIFSPLFIKKYEDKGIRNTEELIAYLKSQGMSDEEIKREVDRIVKEVELEEDVRIPIDIERRVVSKKWITQLDHRVCERCRANSIGGVNHDGVWAWDDTDAPEIPEHPRCRCTYELQYENDRTQEFRAAATMAQFEDVEMLQDAIEVIKTLA